MEKSGKAYIRPARFGEFMVESRLEDGQLAPLFCLYSASLAHQVRVGRAQPDQLRLQLQRLLLVQSRIQRMWIWVFVLTCFVQPQAVELVDCNIWTSVQCTSWGSFSH